MKKKHSKSSESRFAPFSAQLEIPVDTTDFTSLLGGFPSDHTQQSLKVRLVDTHGKVQASITGMTWNLLNICYSTMSSMGAKNGYNNNPLNLDESAEAYYERKMLQLDMLLDTIKSGKVDFIFLQEAKFFSEKDFSAALVKFKKDLKKCGWDLEVTHDADTKHLVTLYNSKLLHPNNELFKSKLFKSDERNKYAGVELNFTYQPSDIPVALTNVHLYETEDYSSEILAYQFQQIEKGIFTIIGGDTNHPLGYQQIGLIGDPSYATCLLAQSQVQPSDDENTYSNLVDLRLDSTLEGVNYIARYDGFFANPASDDTKIVATEKPGLFFLFDEANHTLQVKPLVPAKTYPDLDTHESMYGLPYVADGYQKILSAFGANISEDNGDIPDSGESERTSSKSCR